MTTFKQATFSIFLTTQFCKFKPSTSTTATKAYEVKTQSKTQLNIDNFKLDEEIKVMQSLQQLKESSKRRSNDSTALKSLNHQISIKESELSDLQKKQSEIDKEQRMRKHKSKLTIF